MTKEQLTRTRRANWAAENAAYFLEAAKNLCQDAERVTEDWNISLENQGLEQLPPQADWTPEDWDFCAKARSSGYASALLALLATEIALKAYHIRDLGKHPHDHNLWELFEQLKPSTQAGLKELGSEVPETLKKYRNGFVSLRYIFEDLGNVESVKIPKPSNFLHLVAEKIVTESKKEHQL